MRISKINIRGLFDKHDVDLEINDNALILVGANGLGKSTVLNIVYYTLAKQWDLLPSLPFRSISIDINEKTLTLDNESLRNSSFFSSTKPSNLLVRARQSVARASQTQLLMNFDISTLRRFRDAEDSKAFIEAIQSVPHAIDFDEAWDAWKLLSKPENSQLADDLLHSTPVSRAFEIVSELSSFRTMYLPTYRRIEKSLQDIFPDIDEAIARYEGRRSGPSRQRTALVEFVQFGMKDVSDLFKAKTEEIRGYVNRVLSATSGNYLRDVLRGQGKDYDASRIRGLDNTTISKLLHRYQAEPFTSDDIARLHEVTETVRNSQPLSDDQRLIAHYIIKLVEAVEVISKIEKPVKDFAAVASEYFYDKAVELDENEATISVKNTQDSAAVDLKDLSSGEKQILSLLSHVYLEDRGTLLFIDEPELSLSVDWQIRLLPDLRLSGRCVFLLGVTHSPFVFDNELRDNTVDLRSALSRMS